MSLNCVGRNVRYISTANTETKFNFHFSPMIKKSGEVAAARLFEFDFDALL